MSLKGIKQLKELKVLYSDLDGSSKGIREWMRTSLLSLATNNPELLITTEKKRSVHPYLRGIYINGNTKTICVRNKEPDEINDFAMFLRNQIGRRMNTTGYKKPVLSNRPSIQGVWHEKLNLNDLKFTVTTTKINE